MTVAPAAGAVSGSPCGQSAQGPLQETERRVANTGGLMSTTKIDTLVVIIADQNGGKSNQMRSIFEEFELHHCYTGYPRSNMIARKYYVHPDIDLFFVYHRGTRRTKLMTM
jgi:hypothetical protein